MNKNYIKITTHDVFGRTTGLNYINKSSIFQIITNGPSKDSDKFSIKIYYSINNRVQANNTALNSSVIHETFTGNNARAIMSQLDLD